MPNRCNYRIDTIIQDKFNLSEIDTLSETYSISLFITAGNFKPSLNPHTQLTINNAISLGTVSFGLWPGHESKMQPRISKVFPSFFNTTSSPCFTMTPENFQYQKWLTRSLRVLSSFLKYGDILIISVIFHLYLTSNGGKLAVFQHQHSQFLLIPALIYMVFSLLFEI